MIGEQTRVVRAALLIADLTAVAVAFLAAYSVRAALLTRYLGPIHLQAPALLIALPVWALSFYLSGLYRAPAPRSSLRENAALLRATMFAAFALASCLFALKLVLISRLVIALFLVFSIPSVIGARAAMRGLVLNGRLRRQVVIAGGKNEVVRAASLVAANREWGLSVSGLISDGTWPIDEPNMPAPVLGREDHLPEILQRHVVDELLIVPSPDRLDQASTILVRCYEEGIMAGVLLNFIPAAHHIGLEKLGGLPLVTLSTAPKDELLLWLRRVMDVVLAIVLLGLLSPLFLSIAVAIKLSSPGPIIFKQLRAGLRGRRFWLLKFRSMVADAEAMKMHLAPYNEMDGPAFKMSNDPRVTAVGRLLRKTSLDELPQLWNILRGEMSFVGPRPVVVDELLRYEPWQRRRLSMKPGLTCLWQISGRNELTFDEWMRLDLQYVDNWSLWLDLQIAFRTIPAVLLGKGAK